MALIELLLLCGITLATANNCDCGYTLNTTLFTDTFRTDFTQPGNVTWTSDPGVFWQGQAYNTSAAAARGPYGKAAELGNVALNTSGSDPGLQLWVRSSLVDNGTADQLVPLAEVVTARNDFLYGSFRVSMKTTAINGTCGAFFLYHNDSEEIDIEMLSKQQNSTGHLVNLVNQSPQSVASEYK
jgi:beta-glucanase (GH16 family)